MNIQLLCSENGAVGRYARQELAYFLGKYTGVTFSELPDFVIELGCNAALAPHCYGWTAKDRALILEGGSPASLLCCVYELLGEMGVCFTSEGDFLTKPVDISSVRQSRQFSPVCRFRGIRQHINFPMDISSYSLKDAKEYIRRLARMQYNAITFHSYNGQWHCSEKNGRPMSAGHFFYGQRHQVPDDPALAAAVDNRKCYCIPEAEPILEDEGKREQFAIYWLREVIETAKTAGMQVTVSIECQQLTPLSTEIRMASDIQRQYPALDLVELITPEGGGDDSRVLTFSQAYAQCCALFGKAAADPVFDRCRKEHPGMGENTPLSGALDGTMRSIHQIMAMYDCREQWLQPGKQLQVGLYVTCRETLRMVKPLMDAVFPADLLYSFLPAHGAEAAAEAAAFMELSSSDLQRTMLYSWLEFDGNMYLLQNSCGGVYSMLAYCMKQAPSIHGICFNHWRTAENSLTISYAAQACRTPVTPLDFYGRYAAAHGIEKADYFASQMQTLEALDTFNRDHLFNVGFCFLGCWLNPKGLGWVRNWKRKEIHHSMETYAALAEGFASCLAASRGPEAIFRLRLLENRCRASLMHLRAIDALCQVAGMTNDRDEPTDLKKQEIRQLCHQADAFAAAYLRLHLQQMPDRGCQGTLVSYWATIPVYIDHTLQYFVTGEPVCHHHPKTLDTPPSPDITFF